MSLFSVGNRAQGMHRDIGNGAMKALQRQLLYDACSDSSRDTISLKVVDNEN